MLIRLATPTDAGGIARVHVDAWRATYAGIVPEDYLAGLAYAAREARWRERLSAPGASECTFVAVDSAGQVVGFASGGPQRAALPGFPGELYAIYLLRAAQRQGTGRQLTAAVAARLSAVGMGAMVIWVLADNPARGFYEALGGQVVGNQSVEIGGAQISEVAYGWRDLAPLLLPTAAPDLPTS